MKTPSHSPRPSPNRRRAILSEHDLELAPAACRELFWLGYNRRRRRQPRPFADLVGPALDEALRANEGDLARVRALWHAALPAQYAGRTEVEQLAGGRVTIRVDSAATRYALGRRHGRALLEALRAQLPGISITEIRYRLAAGDRPAEERGGLQA